MRNTTELTLFLVTRPLFHPFKIDGWSRWNDSSHPTPYSGSEGVRNEPSVMFGMPVSEGKVGSIFVIRCRQIAPLIIIQFIHKKTIVDGVRMFIEENENSRRI